MLITRPVPKNFDEMVKAMLTCEQTSGQSVYQHGQSVRQHTFDLIHHLQKGYDLDGWRIPEWLNTYGSQIVNNLRDEGKIHMYTLYHDCGKPYCRVVDKKLGTVHFPDHAEVSKHIYHCVGGNEIVANLIGWDMVIHIATAEEIAHYCKNIWDIEDAMTLILVSLAEIHSNAKLFGGIESTSFKSKWKKVDRRGNQICKHFFEES
jgi:hypothetical protein